MIQTFESCNSLKKAPKLSNNLQELSYTFSGCSSLEIAPTIPNSVERMDGAFGNCSSLSNEIVINANPTNYGIAFHGVDMSKITLSGTSTMKRELANTGLNAGQVTIIE
jgi:hypothetical protein